MLHTSIAIHRYLREPGSLNQTYCCADRKRFVPQCIMGPEPEEVTSKKSISLAVEDERFTLSLKSMDFTPLTGFNSTDQSHINFIVATKRKKIPAFNNF